MGLRLIAEPGQLCLTLQDQCEEYNPLQSGERRCDPGVSGEGGLGIGLLRQHARDVDMVARRPC